MFPECRRRRRRSTETQNTLIAFYAVEWESVVDSRSTQTKWVIV